jgi:hypothetical protein
MTRRKGEITARMNERDYPHIVELAVPSGGFRSKWDEMVAFHRDIEARRGRGRNDDGQEAHVELLHRSCARRCSPSSVWWRQVDVSGARG